MRHKVLTQGILEFDYRETRRSQTKKIDSTRVDLRPFYQGLEKKDLDLAFSVLDAYRIKISHTFDKLSSLSNSRTRLLPHQLEATHRVANALRPRFLIADEVGLGKTIEAGLIMKELMLRRGYERVFVAVPAPLAMQWIQEMKNKFNEDFVLLDRSSFKTISKNWKAYPKVITSIDFIKNPAYGDELFKAKWDLAVFDEAHRLRRDYFKSTKAYAFAENMSHRVDSLLLLSATPFRGKLEELFYLVRLIDPHLLGPHSSFIQEYVVPSKDDAVSDKSMADLREKISRILVRRRKVEVGGFTKRFACTVRFDLSPEERVFYDTTTEYVRREYNSAMQAKNRAIGFVMIAFQKLLDSSTRALLRALEKRKAMLESKMHGIGRSSGGFSRPAVPGNPFLDADGNEKVEKGGSENDIFESDEWDEAENMEELLDSIEREEGSTFTTMKEMRREILMLGHLIELGRSIRVDRKLVKLKETLNRLKKEGHKKFIIFTQFRSTQDYLAENLQEYSVTLFHGSLNLMQKEQAVEDFKNHTEIFIATEAGGEGRNLQFSNCLINYDLPWSPLKVEQRIGRVHRFGQVSDVYIFNFATRDTVAERILEVLERKIRMFEESIGPSDAILGAVEDEGNFQRFLMQFVSGQKSKKDFEAEMDSMMKIAEVGYRKLNELVTPKMVDFNLDDYYNFTNQTRELENDEIEKIVGSYLDHFQEDRWGLTPDRDDYRLRDREQGTERIATFRSDRALKNEKMEFLAVGHPLVDRAIQSFLEHSAGRSIHTVPASKELPSGIYFVALVRYLNGLSRAELMSCFVDPEGNTKVLSQEAPFPPGFRSGDFKNDLSRIRLSKAGAVDHTDIEKAGELALAALRAESEKRGLELKERLHPVFKKEEYKMEISYQKKIRQLEEKRDRQKMRYRMDPRVENRSSLTRTENEILRAKQEIELHTERIRRDSRVETRLEILQIYQSV